MEYALGTQTAILIGVWATFALDVYSTLNSSPQTTELFATDRASSLWHWVLIGGVVGIGGGLAATLISHSLAPLVAVTVVTGMMLWMYRHALRRGGGTADSGCGCGQREVIA